jgi:CO dehydrogenase maturation factor
MRVAFVGKGGSGKSTMSSLFITYLHHKIGADILALDADLNMNLSGLLGVEFPASKHLSSPDNSANLRKFLKGQNSLIRDENAFLPTTPSGVGSNVIRDVDDKNLLPYSVLIQQNPTINLLTVGTYVAEEIGQACYHTNLFVAENLLMHTDFKDEQWIVADMVAGTDAFSYSLHLQFDAIILIAEPTPESAEVCKLYYGLAKEAGIENLVHVVANKVENEDDLNFIRKVIGREVLGFVPSMPQLRKFRQQGGSVTPEMLSDNLCALFQKIKNVSEYPNPNYQKRFQKLKELHYKLCSQYWVTSGYGEDVIGQYGEDVSQRKVG